MLTDPRRSLKGSLYPTFFYGWMFGSDFAFPSMSALATSWIELLVAVTTSKRLGQRFLSVRLKTKLDDGLWLRIRSDSAL